MELIFTVLLSTVLGILLLLFFQRESLTNLSEKHVPSLVDPNCLSTTKQDLLNQFHDEKILRQTMNRLGFPLDFEISDATAPSIASNLLKTGYSFNSNCVAV
jgi:hypothetical protein